MRGIIVGFGTIAMGHALGYAKSDGIDIVGVIDPSPQRRAVAEQEFGLRGFSTVEEAIQHAKPDFLDICAPPHVHLTYACTGLANDLHVICEKPVFPSIVGKDFARLQSHLGVTDAVFYPAHNYKFAPILEAMRRVCRSPEFGELLSARFRTLRSGHAVGVAEWHPHWRRDRRVSGGGILMDHGTHSIYLAMLLTRSVPRMVACLSGRFSDDEHIDTEDTVLLRIASDNGVRIDLDLSWAASVRNSYYSITGTGGVVVVENDELTHTLQGRVNTNTLQSNFDDPSHREWFRKMFSDFRAVVAEPERQWALIGEAWTTAAVIAAAYRSAGARGRWTKVGSPPAWLAAKIAQATVPLGQDFPERCTDAMSHAEP